MNEIAELEKDWLEHQKLIVLLPILEFSYPDVLGSIPKNSNINRELLTELVAYSLVFPSRHWALSALSWLENGFQVNERIYEQLKLISNSKSDSQALRHKAVAQANKWKRANGI